MSQEFQLVHNDGGKRDGDTDAHKESFLTGKSEGKAITEAQVAGEKIVSHVKEKKTRELYHKLDKNRKRKK